MRTHQTNTPAKISFPTPAEAWPFPVATASPFPVPTVSVQTNTVQDDMKDLDIRVCHGYDPQNNRGGVTIAYRKCSNWKNTKMVEVSLAYCSSKDSFSKKVGTQLAVERFLCGNTVALPVRFGRDDSIVGNLLHMFWYSGNIRV